MTSPPPAAAPAPPGVWATFPDPELERRYRAAHAADDRANARLVLVVAAVASTAFALTDLRQPDRVEVMLGLRAVAVLSALALFVWLRRPRPVATVDWVLLVWGLSVAAWYAAVQVSRPPGHLGPTTATLSTIVLTYTIVPLPLWRLTAIGLTMLAGCLGVAVWVNPVTDPASFTAIMVWVVVANVLGWTAARRLQTRGRQLYLTAADLERTLAEVRTLRGLIRICAWCKGIHADGEWQRLERYVAANSHAEFTHGICPACLAAQRVTPEPASLDSRR